ncbi:MAG: phosphoribosylglycinamide formyltransferase [Candidatus Promineifilaceae bacterium]
MMRLVVMISGSGSNLQAIMDAIEDGRLSAEIVLVVSNRKAAYGLVRAETAGIPTLYFPLKPYSDSGRSREEYDRDLAEAVGAETADLVVLAGWMHILSPAFLEQFPNKVINLHPALPGTFAGTHAIERAYEAFQAGEIAYSGCMIHYVIPKVDAGPTVDQEQVPIYRENSLADFEARMHSAEHRLIVRAIGKIIGG